MLKKRRRATYKLRDGRKLRGEMKPKSQLAIARFLSRGGGFFGAGPDSNLCDLGLQSLMPSHYSRTSFCRTCLNMFTAPHSVSGPQPTSYIGTWPRHMRWSPRSLVMQPVCSLYGQPQLARRWCNKTSQACACCVMLLLNPKWMPLVCKTTGVTRSDYRHTCANVE